MTAAQAFPSAPPAGNFKPWTHVPNQVPLNQGVTATAANTTTTPDLDD